MELSWAELDIFLALWLWLTLSILNSSNSWSNSSSWLEKMRWELSGKDKRQMWILYILCCYTVLPYWTTSKPIWTVNCVCEFHDSILHHPSDKLKEKLDSENWRTGLGLDWTGYSFPGNLNPFPGWGNWEQVRQGNCVPVWLGAIVYVIVLFSGTIRIRFCSVDK